LTRKRKENKRKKAETEQDPKETHVEANIITEADPDIASPFIPEPKIVPKPVVAETPETEKENKSKKRAFSMGSDGKSKKD